jgi:hypothetical protein
MVSAGFEPANSGTRGQHANQSESRGGKIIEFNLLAPEFFKFF